MLADDKQVLALEHACNDLATVGQCHSDRRASGIDGVQQRAARPIQHENLSGRGVCDVNAPSAVGAHIARIKQQCLAEVAERLTLPVKHMHQLCAVVRHHNLAARCDSDALRVLESSATESVAGRASGHVQPYHPGLAILSDQHRVPHQHRSPWLAQVCPLPRDVARAFDPPLIARHDNQSAGQVTVDRQHGRGALRCGWQLLLLSPRAVGPHLYCPGTHVPVSGPQLHCPGTRVHVSDEDGPITEQGDKTRSLEARLC
jgi:hypothetical protein